MRPIGAALRDIAKALNRAGLTTSCGTAWRATQVSRLLQAMEEGLMPFVDPGQEPGEQPGQRQEGA